MQVSTNMWSGNPLRVRRKKFGLGSFLLLLIVGVTFIVAGIVAYKADTINASWYRVSGVVVGVQSLPSSTNGTTYTPTVKYVVQGQTYTVSSSSSSSTYPAIGSSRQVAFDPNQPGDAKVVDGTGSQLLILLFLVIGALLVIATPVFYVNSLRRSKDITNLTRSGQKIRGIITDIQTTAANQQGGSMYRIVVTTAGPGGAAQSFTSNWIQDIGGLTMVDFRSNPVPIDVYVNPANPQDYYVDVSEVPSLTPERIAELIRRTAQPPQP